MTIRKLTAVFAFLSVISIQSAYAETCQTHEYVPAEFKCDTPNSADTKRFDDFSNGSCKFIPAHTVSKDIPCPAWRIPPDESYSATVTCSLHKQVPGSLNGEICASGERRPTNGSGASSINYRYGKSGTNHDRFINDKGGDEIVQRNGNYFCYGMDKRARQKHDFDRTDRVVAYYCK